MLNYLIDIKVKSESDIHVESIHEMFNQYRLEQFES